MYCMSVPCAPDVGMSVHVPCALSGPHFAPIGPGTILLPRLPPAVLGAGGPTTASRSAQVCVLVACLLHSAHGWPHEALNPHVLGHQHLHGLPHVMLWSVSRAAVLQEISLERHMEHRSCFLQMLIQLVKCRADIYHCTCVPGLFPGVISNWETVSTNPCLCSSGGRRRWARSRSPKVVPAQAAHDTQRSL